MKNKFGNHHKIPLTVTMIILLCCISLILACGTTNPPVNSTDESVQTAPSSSVAPTALAMNPSITPTITPSIESEDIDYSYDLYSLDFVDESNGWVILWNYNTPNMHDTTSLVHTMDGGTTWESYESQNCLLEKVSFANSKIGWALAVKGYPYRNDGTSEIYQILYTEDGGINWTIQANHAAICGESLDILAYGTKSACAVIGGILYRTEDGGKNWFIVDIPVTNFYAEHISFTNDSNGWVSGVVKSSTTYEKTSTDITSKPDEIYYHIYVIHTTDGGKSWQTQFMQNCGNEWNETIGISFADNDNGWFLTCDYGTFDGALYHTDDGGSKWELVSKMRVCRPYAQEVEAVTSKILWIPMHAGAGPIDGGMYYSEDGGKSFDYVSTESGIENSNGVEFITPTLGWAVMNGYTEKYLIKTTDGGHTWNKVILPYMEGYSKTDVDNHDVTLTSESIRLESEADESKITGYSKIASDNKTEELLNEIETYSVITFSLYNYPSYYYDALLNKLVVFNEFLACEDYAAATLSSYKKADFYENTRQKNQNDEDWDSYKTKAIKQDHAIAFDEILLANNDTFRILSEEDRVGVLNTVKEKLDLRSSGNYFTTYNSPFLFYVQEQNTGGNSQWYQYIMDFGEEYSVLKDILNKEILSWGKFNY